MIEYDGDYDFQLDKVRREPAKYLPDGWYWIKYNDGSGCLRSPEGEEYMSYDLSTHEYQVTRDSHCDFFPLSYFYGDGVDISEFKPFEFMEKELKRLYFKETPLEKQERLTEQYKEYQDTRNNISESFNYDDFGFYLGINNIKEDLPIEEIDRLMKICYRNLSYYMNSLFLAETLTEAVYIKNFLSLDDLEKVPSEDITEILVADKPFLLEKYSSKENDLEK